MVDLSIWFEQDGDTKGLVGGGTLRGQDRIEENV